MSFQPVDIAVKHVDRPQHRWHFARRVAVGVLGVVDERHSDGSIFGRYPRSPSLRPRPAGDDRRLARARGQGRRRQRQARANAGGARRLCASWPDASPFTLTRCSRAPLSVRAARTCTAVVPPVHIGSPTCALFAGALPVRVRCTRRNPAAPVAVSAAEAQPDAHFGGWLPLEAYEIGACRELDGRALRRERSYPALGQRR